MQEDKKIWTIGHSTRSLDELIALLHSFNIKLLVDIRSYPGSRRFPHFNKPALEDALKKENILYCHMPGLGGRRKPKPDSKNILWKHPAFRAYADYMETDDFKKAINELEEKALKHNTAYMCAEALWWKCHRSLVSDDLKRKGWTVLHITAEGKAQEHPYTGPARMQQGQLF